MKNILKHFFERNNVKDKSFLKKRDLVTRLFLKGNGIEIGALHNPLKVPSIARVKYVDRMSVPDLKKQYIELSALDLVDVDIVDDGEKLEKIQ